MVGFYRNENFINIFAKNSETMKHLGFYTLILGAGLMAASLASCNTSKNGITATPNASQSKGSAQGSSAASGNLKKDSRSTDDYPISTMPIKVPIMKIDSVAIIKVDGMWTLRSINGVTLSAANGDDDENRPYINFDSRTAKFYANDGCNTINGDFSVSQNNAMAINPLLSTMMICPDARYEQQFKQGIANVASFQLEKKNNENILTLLNDKKKPIMTLVRPMTDFLNGSWKVSEINGTPVANDGVKMVIDIPEHKVHGNTGCNVFNGTIFVDPDVDGSIQFQQVGVTRMLCPDMETESAFLVALESVVTAQESHGTAILYNSRHQPVLKLTPLALKAE